MSGNRKGGIAARESNTSRYGKDFYSRIGKIGGVKKHPKKGFGSNKKLAEEAGKIGGAISRRGPAPVPVPRQMDIYELIDEVENGQRS